MKKYFLDGDAIWDDKKGPKDIINEVLNDPELPKITSIVIGCYGESDESAQDIIDMFVKHKDRFLHIESLFIGDMDYEENEVSWIVQGNYEELLKALPGLKSLTVKGSNELTFGQLSHDNLEELKVICGGLPKNVWEELKNSKLPKLQSLILYVGIDVYGFDGDLNDVKALARKEQFPNLKVLGFVDSEIQDEITKMVLESDILPQLDVLMLSYGTLTDEGGQALLDGVEKIKHLKELDLEHHYFSKKMMEKLNELPISVNLKDANSPEDDYKCPVLTE